MRAFFLQGLFIVTRSLSCLFATLLLSGMAGAGAAQDFPQLQVGDTWQFKQTLNVPSKPETVSVTPVFALDYKNKLGDLVLAIKPFSINGVNYAGRLIGPVSASTCLYDVIANSGALKNCDVALQNGNSWSTDDSNTVERVQETVKIGAIEDVDVPAGKFAATKIVVEKTVTEFAFKGVPEPSGGYVKRYVTTYWYSPDTKTMVKVIREKFNANGSTSTTTDELNFYSLGSLH